MSASVVSDNDPELLFAWDSPRGRTLAVLGFLFASVLLHAFCFYLFQIVYPPAVALLPPPGRVSLIAPNTEEGRVLLRWLEAEDPALASSTQRSADENSTPLPTIQHAPSYLTRHPALKGLPPYSPDLRVPTAQPPAPVEQPRPQIETVTRIAPTVMSFSEEMETLGAAQIPEMKFNASNRESPKTAQFRIAVNENGEVRYCFLQASSGDATLDEQAGQYLALSRFPTTENLIRLRQTKIQNGLIWGAAIVEWGNDVAVPAASSTGNMAP